MVSNQVIEHLYEPDILFKEVNRILSRGGLFILSTPNLCAFHNRLLVLLGMQPTTIPPFKKVFGNPARGDDVIFGGPKHINGFSPAAIKEGAIYYGFKLEKYSGIGFYPFPLALSRLFSSVFPSLSVYHLLVLRKTS